LTLPDPDDRQVLAAAIRTSADVILTFNIKDFPADSLAPYGIETCHPDPFLVDQLDLDPQTVCLAGGKAASGRPAQPAQVCFGLSCDAQPARSSRVCRWKLPQSWWCR
jgi:hypothetical protein